MPKFILVSLCLAMLSAFTISSHATKAHLENIETDAVFTQLSKNVWMHTSYKSFDKWGTIPANGLIVLDEESSTLIDTAWNNAQTKTILEWAKTTLKHPITRAVFTHAHSDKMGGVETVRSYGIKTWANPHSNDLAPSNKLLPAEFNLSFDNNNKSSDISPLIAFKPGAGHTLDNIVVYLPDEKMLYGGCLIRPGNAKGMGNTQDGDVNSWDGSVKSIIQSFPAINSVIPTHGAPGGKELLEHTIKLVEKHRGSLN
ncbi:MAG: subclass B1 metallo-beta-lactamase [Cellvibrionaceae bacterium]|nr:subclass B1 metallo-beta-lactamase [Cellvibrionaceae bacterium]